MSGYPQKLVDLQWLEDELHDVNQDEVSLDWNRQHRCVEHKFSDDWEVEYCVLEHWAGHVGAKFKMTDRAVKTDTIQLLSIVSMTFSQDSSSR